MRAYKRCAFFQFLKKHAFAVFTEKLFYTLFVFLVGNFKKGFVFNLKLMLIVGNFGIYFPCRFFQAFYVKTAVKNNFASVFDKLLGINLQKFGVGIYFVL